ncbi:hypothetical protein D3C81_1809370 [compost metagenome]
MLHARQEFLQVYSGIAEGLLRLLLGSGNLLHQGFLILGNADAFAAAACSSLNDDRITDVAAQHNCFLNIPYQPVRAGNDRNTGKLHRFLRYSLVAHAGNSIR